jgi:hypothetical protein
MEIIVAEFALHPKHDQNAAGHARRQTGDIYKGVGLFFEKNSEGNF